MTIVDDYFRALVSGRRRGFWPGLLRGGLRAASIPYGWATCVRNRLFDNGILRSYRASVPVVSVGNLTLGGTGKTPCVEYVARFYRKQARRVAILSRGYGSNGRNDEALLLEENLPEVPHLQGRDRVALARQAATLFASEALVLDDGFQHRWLARDLDVVLIDATQPWGHGYLFPRGLLRESPHGLHRAGVVMLTRCDQVDEDARERLKQETEQLAPGVPVAETTHRPLDLVNSKRSRAGLERLQGRPIAAFCGIGNPVAFQSTLAGLGESIVAFRSFPDHHSYSRHDLADLSSWAQYQPTDCIVVTTQKDLVKLRTEALGDRELWALRIGLHFGSGQEMLERKLQAVMETRSMSVAA